MNEPDILAALHWIGSQEVNRRYRAFAPARRRRLPVDPNLATSKVKTVLFFE
jgi:hypothetical protein